MPKNWEARERKADKRHRLRIMRGNRSVFTLQEIINRKAEAAREWQEQNGREIHSDTAERGN